MQISDLVERLESYRAVYGNIRVVTVQDTEPYLEFNDDVPDEPVIVIE